MLNSTPNVLTVSSLNFYIKSIIDDDSNLNDVFVEGEISNFKNHFASGHYYFSLKDEKSNIKCVMFKGNTLKLKFIPETSMKVIVRGKVSVFDRDGQYQIYVEDMKPSGIGELALKFEQLKKKLELEGLFSQDTKRAIPKTVNRVAVITSETGAAVQDIVSILNRRNPLIEVVLCPVIVQGELAPGSMIKALNTVYSLDNIDLIIIGRGGGSMEDLFCFNDELLVRKIYESPIPVISAVGHETDFTLCDFVADIRAATPSAAAELATVNMSEKINNINTNLLRIREFCISAYNYYAERLDKVVSSYIFESPKNLVMGYENSIKNALLKLLNTANHNFKTKEENTLKNIVKLDALNPTSLMMRGYTVTTNTQGKVISKLDEVNCGDEITVNLQDGKIFSKVIKKEKGNL